MLLPLPSAKKVLQTSAWGGLCWGVLSRGCKSLAFASWARVLLVFGLAAAGAFSTRLAVSSAHSSVDIAMKPGWFTPSSIEVHVDEPAVLRFNNSEGVHGVESAEIGLPNTVIVPGTITDVSLHAQDCGDICGALFNRMRRSA